MKTRTSLILLALAVLALVAVQPARAAIVYWDEGATTQLWSDTTNFNPDGAPGTGDDVVLDDTYFAMSGKYALGVDSSIGTLTLNSAAMTDLDANISGTDARVLTLNGSGSNPLITVGTSANAAVNIGLTGGVGTLSITLAASGSIDVASAKTLTIASAIGESGSQSLTKTGAGTLVLSSANSYSGTTTVNDGILQAGSATAFGPAANASLIFGAGSTGTVQLYGNNITVIGLNTNATVGTPIVESGSATAGTDTLTVNNATANTFAGVLRDGSTRALALTKGAAGALTLSGANTYTGVTSINNGIVQANHATALGNGGDITFGGGTLQFGSALNNQTVAWGARIKNSTAAVALHTNSYNVTLSGTIPSSNTQGLIKSGAGTLTVSSPQSYTGATIVNGGTLQLYSAFNPSLGVGLKGGWTFNGQNANDSSGNGWNGTGVNSPTYSTTDTHTGTGASLQLTSASSQLVYVDTGGSGNQTVFDGGTAMTISAWVKGWPSAGWNPFVSKFGENSQGWQMRRIGSGNTNRLCWTTRGPTNGDMASSTTVVSDGAWHMVTMTYDAAGGANNKKIYVDGTLDSQATATGNIGASLAMMAFGARASGDAYSTTAWGGYFNGKLDDIYFYNRALSATEIAALQTANNANTTITFVPATGFLPAATDLGIASGSTLDLNGVSQQVASLADYSGGGGSVINSSGSTPVTLTVSTAGVASFSGVIGTGGGTINLTMSGAGTQVLAGANTYTGTTTVSGGELQLSGSGTLGAGSGTLTVNTGGTLDLNNTSQNVGNLTGTGGTIVNNHSGGAGTVTLTIGNGNTGGGSYAGIIADNNDAGTGTIALTKTGSGTIALTGANTYTGVTAINAGTLSINAVAAGVGAQPLGKNTAVTLGVAATSSGTLLYTGGAGTLDKNITALGNGSDTIQNSGSGLLTLSGTLTKNGTTLTLRGGTNGISVGGQIVGALPNSDLVISGGTTTVTNTNTYNGATWINVGGTLQIGGGSTTGQIPIGSAITDNGTLTFNRIDTVTQGTDFSTAGISGTGNLIQAGSGTLVLNANNTFSGGVALNAGTLTASNAGALGTGTLTINAGTLDSSVASLVISAKPVTINADFAFTGTNSLSLGTGAYSLGTAAGTTRTITANANTLALGGVISNGTTANSLTKAGGGTLLLSGANLYTGATTVNDGILQAGSATAFGPAANASLVFGASSTGTVQLYGNNITVIGLNTNATVGTPYVESGSGAAGTDTLTVNNAAANTFAGVLRDGSTRLLALTKSGFGTLTLSGANTYTGGTNVSGGTLLWSGANNLPATGTLQVNGGGNFSLADGTAQSTSTAALSLAANSALNFDWIGSATDTLVSTAAATTVAGTVQVRINPTTPSNASGPYTLISSSGGGLNSASYCLANNTNFTATLSQSNTAVTINNYAAVAALTNAYWLGNQVTGAPGAMALSSGTTSNWASAAAGTPAGGVVPGGSAVNVIFGATGASQQANVTTGADMNLGSITFNDTAAVTIGGSNYITLNSTSGTAASTTGALQTVTAGSAISVTTYANAANTINANLVLGAGQTWNVAGTKTLNVNGVVTGANNLTIGTSGNTGTVVLAGANTYTGATAVNYGTAKAGVGSVANVSGAFGNNSAVTMGNNAGATLDLNGYNTRIGSLAGGGATGGNVTLGTATLTVGGNNTSPAAYSGVISGGADPATGVSLYKIGTGNLQLSRANTFTGKIVIDGGGNHGKLIAGNNNGTGGEAKLGTAPSTFQADNITIRNGGHLVMYSDGDNNSNLGANRGIYLDTGTQYIDSGGGDFVINGVISGPGSLFHSNQGWWGWNGRRMYLAAANTFTGDTWWDASGTASDYGGIQMNNQLALQYSALDCNSLASWLGTNAGTDGTVYLGGLVNGNRSWASMTGTANPTNLVLQPQIPGVTKTFTNVISGTMNLVKAGPGTQALNGLNTYTGATSIKAGTLSINTIKNVGGGASSLGAPTTVPNGTIAIGDAATGATLVYTGTGDTTDRVINLAGTTGGATLDQSGGSGVLTLNGNITATVAGAKTLTLQGSTGGAGVIGGIIADSSLGATSLTKTGTGTWTLSAANTYTGNTTLSGGTLTIGNNLALQNSALNYTGSTLGFSGGINTPTFGGLTGSTSLSLASNVTDLTLNPGNGVTKTYSGSLGSDLPGMNLAKTGSGTQVLGAATYTGSTAVNVGKLYLNGANATSAISVAGGATLGGSGSAASATATVANTGIVEAGYSGLGTLSLGGLGFTNTGRINVANIGNYSINPAVNVINSGGLTVNGGAGSVTIALSGASPASGSAHLIQYAGAIGGTGAGFGAFTVDPSGLGAGPRSTFTLSNPAGYVDMTWFVDHPVWSGARSGDWITSPGLTPPEGTPTNWVLDSNPLTETNFIASDAPVFDDSVASGTTTVDISAADVSPASVKFDNTTGKTYTLQSSGSWGITGGTSLTKSNTGRLIVTTDNSYNGGTIISGGTIQVGAAGTTGTLGSGAITDNAVLEFNRTNTLTMAMAISGTGSVVQNGSGTLELNGANSYQGGTTINDGTVTLGNATALGTGTLTINGCAIDSSVASLVLTPDNAQVWNSDFTFAGTNDLDLGGGTVSLGSTAGTRTVTVDANTLTVGGVISNGTATGLTKAGAGMLVLSGANLYTGATTIDAGTLRAGSATAFGPAASADLVFGSGSTGIVQLNGNNMTVVGLNTNTTVGTPIVESGSAAVGTDTLTVNTAGSDTYAGELRNGSTRRLALTKGGLGTLTLSSTSTYTGDTTLNEGTLSINSLSNLGTSGTIRLSSGTFQYTGSDEVSSGRFLLQGGTETFDITQSAANLTMTQTYSASTIIKKGAGKLTFGGNVGWDHANYGNGTIAVDNGTVVLDAWVHTDNGNNPLFHAMFKTVDDVQSGATLKLGTTYNDIKLAFNNTFHMSGGTYDINGVTNNGCAQIDGSGTITNNGAADATVNVFANLTNAFSGNIVDGTSHKTGLLFGSVGGFGGSGAAVWTLSGTNTYTGATTVGVGTLKAGSATAFSPNSVFTVNATLDLAGYNFTIPGLAGAAAGRVQSTGGTAVLTVNNDLLTSNADFTFGGVLQDGGVGMVLGLTKTGSKTLTLSGANTYTGNTTISNGTLALTGSGAINSSPIIDVASLGIFDVSGVTGGYTLDASQTLKGEGTVIGPMTMAGTVSPGSSIGILAVTGDATLTGTYSVDVDILGGSDLLAVTGDLTLGPASVLTIVDTGQLLDGFPYKIATYGGTLTGTFGGGNNLPVQWSVDYGVKTPQAITLVPEPATMALLGLGGLGLILGRKRR